MIATCMSKRAYSWHGFMKRFILYMQKTTQLIVSSCFGIFRDLKLHYSKTDKVLKYSINELQWNECHITRKMTSFAQSLDNFSSYETRDIKSRLIDLSDEYISLTVIKTAEKICQANYLELRDGLNSQEWLNILFIIDREWEIHRNTNYCILLKQENSKN